MDLGLTGRAALVTGAGKGIGRAIARRLAAEGCRLVLVGRTGADLDLVAGELRAVTAVETVAADLSNAETIDAIARNHASVDILVNNAGNIPGGSIHDVSDAMWRQGWDGKVFGYVNMLRRFLDVMEARGSGVILNIIGTAGERPSAAYAAGSAGNAALMALTRALGTQAPDRGVRVLGINPGPVLTERLERILRQRAQKDTGDDSLWRARLEALPFGRAALPEEVADAAAFLVSDRAAYISGTILTVDGGLSGRSQAF